MMSNTNNYNIKILILFSFLFIIVNCNAESVVKLNKSNSNQHIVDLEQTNVDANNMSVKPGDTVCITSGKRKYMRLANFHGDPLNYIVFKNIGGDVIIENDDHYFGLTISDCSFFKLTGTGDKTSKNGIKIMKTFKGASGLSINNLSTDFEIDHLEIANTGFAGIMSFSQPKCDGTSNKGNFVQRNISIHDNYIHRTAGEGMYIGHSFYTGYTMLCDGKSEVLYPHEIKGLKIYNNLVDSTGWDGIQVGCANSDCEIYGNNITHYGVANEKSQNSGIQISGGTTGKCYNNAILNGSGTGISVFGIGNNLIYNNLIVNAGQMGDSIDLLRGGYGIFCDDRSTVDGWSFNFINNTIIAPKTDGIRIYSNISKNNKIINNVILKPGSYGEYKEVDHSYVFHNADVDVSITNNYYSQYLSSFINLDSISNIYNFSSTLPIINKGGDISAFGIDYDFKKSNRIKHSVCDIGAFEFDSIPPEEVSNSGYKIYPNPSKGTFMILTTNKENINRISVNSGNGQKLHEEKPFKTNTVSINMNNVLKKGIYFIDVESKGNRKIEKIIID